MTGACNARWALQDLLSATIALSDATTRVSEVSVPVPGGGTRSKRLADFVTFVEGLPDAHQQRVIGITAYAETEWPARPRELFAESYALWLTDRPFLNRVAPELSRYFSQRKHLT